MDGYRLTIVTEWSQGSQLIQSKDFESLYLAQQAEKEEREMMSRVVESELTAITGFRTFIEKIVNGSTVCWGEELS